MRYEPRVNMLWCRVCGPAESAEVTSQKEDLAFWDSALECGWVFIMGDAYCPIHAPDPPEIAESARSLGI